MGCEPWSKPVFAVASKQISKGSGRVGKADWCERAAKSSQFSLTWRLVCTVKLDVGFLVVKSEGVGGICDGLNKENILQGV